MKHIKNREELLTPFYTARTMQRSFNARKIQGLCDFTAFEMF